MAGSQVRRSTRKREPPQKFEPVDAPSPSRPPKRRKALSADTTQLSSAEVEPDLSIEIEEHYTEGEEEDDDEEKLELQRRTEQVESLIPLLHEASEPINARQQHPNVDRSVRAVAKVAGRHWTFYTRSSDITIGRQGEKKPGKENEPSGDANDDPIPDIDLGPGKHVSREHAKIRYEDDEKWYLIVMGRNGAKVNNMLVKKGQNAAVESGDILEIAGTEMIFVTAVSVPVIQDCYLERLRNQAKTRNEDVANTKESRWATQDHGHPSVHPIAQGFAQSDRHFISPYGPPAPDKTTPSGLEARPITPNDTLVQQHPYLAQQMKQQKLKPLTLESSEQIDYSNDANKEIKPPMSYATLIAQAILAGPNERSSLSGIYDWIKSNFAYYRHIEPAWQNSIRHNLSLNQAFDKVARESHEPGKGGMWFIVPEKKDDFKRMGWKLTSRGGARPSSNPSSPAPPKNKSPRRGTPPQTHDQLADSRPHIGVSKAPTQVSQTPLRQSTSIVQVPKIEPTPQLIDDNSPLPMRQSFLNNNSNIDSPTMLPSGLLDDAGAGTGTLANPFTPAPRRQEPSFNVPSTAKLPSQFLLQSSPAPFWKDFETPIALNQTSPVKAESIMPKATAASSSPPRDEVNGSPTRIKSRPDVSPTDENPPGGSKGQSASGQLDLMGSFPKIGHVTTVNRN